MRGETKRDRERESACACACEREMRQAVKQCAGHLEHSTAFVLGRVRGGLGLLACVRV